MRHLVLWLNTGRRLDMVGLELDYTVSAVGVLRITRWEEGERSGESSYAPGAWRAVHLQSPPDLPTTSSADPPLHVPPSEP